MKVVELSSWQKRQHNELLEQLFREHKEPLCNYIRHRARYLEEPEDIAQEVFLRIANRPDLMDKIQLGVVKKRPYIISMANNLLCDIERKRGVQGDYQKSETIAVAEKPGEPSPEHILTARSELEAMKEVIMNLKPVWRRTFVMRRLLYMSYKEIAERMGVTRRQVEAYMVKALLCVQDAERRLSKGEKVKLPREQR